MSIFLSFSNLNILDAFEFTKFSRKSKYDLTTIDVTINVCDVKHLSSPFDDDVFFILLLVSIGDSSGMVWIRCATKILGAQ